MLGEPERIPERPAAGKRHRGDDEPADLGDDVAPLRNGDALEDGEAVERVVVADAAQPQRHGLGGPLGLTCGLTPHVRELELPVELVPIVVKHPLGELGVHQTPPRPPPAAKTIVNETRQLLPIGLST